MRKLSHYEDPRPRASIAFDPSAPPPEEKKEAPSLDEFLSYGYQAKDYEKTVAAWQHLDNVERERRARLDAEPPELPPAE